MNKIIEAFIPITQMKDQHEHNVSFMYSRLISHILPQVRFARKMEDVLEENIELFVDLHNYNMAFEKLMETIEGLAEYIDPAGIAGVGPKDHFGYLKK